MLGLPHVLFVFHLSNLVDKNIPNNTQPKHVGGTLGSKKPQPKNALSVFVPARAILRVFIFASKNCFLEIPCIMQL